MNVRVNLNYTIYDGAEIVFKAPCNASEVTGLIVYYPAGAEVVSSVFAFADAHTNDLGNIDKLFAKGAVVKVIIDTETNMAFVQNAATNAYLENRFAGIGGGGGGGSLMLVSANGANTSANRDAAEIYTHALTGGVVLLNANDIYYHLISCTPTSAVFAFIGDDYTATTFEIDQEAQMTRVELGYASHAQLGDISTALDHIIELQEELIGL